jgi:adenylate cyclase class IV
MGFKNREVEVKLLLSGASGYDKICAFVEGVAKGLYPKYDTEDDLVIGNATDIYWNAPRSGIGDFVRLRKTSKGGQITLKASDKGNNIDRVEIDLVVGDYKQAKELMFALHGDSKATVTKKYNVYFLEDEHTNISVYQVKNDGRIFVEVEAKSKTRVREIIKALLANADKSWEWKWIQSSIYDMFVCNKKPKEAEVQEFVG